MPERRMRIVAEDLPLIAPGCWPAQEDVDENAELRALAQGTGDHLPYELRLRVAELRARREQPWSPEAA
jgi:hypothetical protein